MSESVLAQIAALKDKTTAQLRALWKELFDRDPPPFGRRYLEDRLSYRIQELRLGGLSDRARRKLDALADQLEPKAARRRRSRPPDRRHAAAQGMERDRARGHSARARFRVRWPAIQIIVGDCESNNQAPDGTVGCSSAFEIGHRSR